MRTKFFSRYETFKALALTLALGLILAKGSLKAGSSPESLDGLPEAAMQFLLDCQDAYTALNFDKAEELANKGVLLAPEHPLPRIFLEGALFARIQENLAAQKEEEPIYARFDLASQAALLASERRAAEKPDARAKLYLGNALGAKGMVSMYRGRYWEAYQDGRKANDYLLETQKLDPKLTAANLGLGQYQYYCGRLSGILRFFLGLNGDIPGGIAMLEECGRTGEYGALPARAALVRIFTEEEVNYPKAVALLEELLPRFPSNHWFARFALEAAQAQGPNDPKSQALVEMVGKNWKERQPPDYAKKDLKASWPSAAWIGSAPAR